MKATAYLAEGDPTVVLGLTYASQGGVTHAYEMLDPAVLMAPDEEVMEVIDWVAVDIRTRHLYECRTQGEA